MKVGDLVFVKHPAHHCWAIVIKNQVHSDDCVLHPLTQDKPVDISKRWVIDSEEMENHYAQRSNGRWDFAQRFETKEAKKEFINKHNAEIEGERRKREDQRREEAKKEYERRQNGELLVGVSLLTFLIVGIGICFYNGAFQLSLLFLAGLMLLS